MITTKYVGPTNTAGSKIVAKGFSRQLTISYDPALNSDVNHKNAADKLMEKINNLPGQQMIYGHELTSVWDDVKNAHIWS